MNPADHDHRTPGRAGLILGRTPREGKRDFYGFASSTTQISTSLIEGSDVISTLFASGASRFGTDGKTCVPEMNPSGWVCVKKFSVDPSGRVIFT